MSRSIQAHWLLASLALVLLLWAASGTLAPYGATIPNNVVSEPCQYLYNSDHGHLIAPFRMFDGAPRSEWDYSVVLRRILYPVVAYPVVKAFGLEAGGLAINILLHLAALGVFALTLRERSRALGMPADSTAIVALWLIATFPGISYWGGVPYSYASIVPVSLVLMAILYKLDSLRSSRGIIGLALLSGILFTAYDFVFYFGVAFLLQLAVIKRWKLIFPCILLLILPQEFVNQWLRLVQKIHFDNSNTATFGKIINTWLHPELSREWLDLLIRLPYYVIDNYFSSTHLGLPLLFAVLVGIVVRKFGIRYLAQAFTNAEITVLAVTVALFLFNNLAPPYPGWQMRGSWIPRIYQPVFVVMIGFSARILAQSISTPYGMVARKPAIWLLATTLAFNASVAFGPLLGLQHADIVHWLFYKHAPLGTLSDNLDKYGRRPLGFCHSKGDL